MKFTAGILFVYIQDTFGRINNAKGKRSNPNQFYLFSFPALKRQSRWMHRNVGLNPHSFNVLWGDMGEIHVYDCT